MRCRTCDYTLFDIRQRTCPECGSPFKPSEFDFQQTAVRFLCPHCEQDYYGMDERGHLVPRDFDCVKCSQHITMDEMIVQPTVGVAEESTQQDPLPWNDKRRRSPILRFFATVGWSMGRPVALGRALQRDVRVGRSLFFAWFISISYGAWLLPFFVLGSMGRSTSNIVLGVLPALAIYFGVCTFGCIAVVVLWSLIAHAIISVGSDKHRSMSTTTATIAYAFGPGILIAFPCVGIYAVPVVLIWMAICLSIAFKAAHGCSITRGILAAITVPLIGTTIVVALIIAFVVPEFARIRATPAFTPQPAVTTTPQTAPSQSVPAPAVTDPAPESTPAEPSSDQPATLPAPATEPQDKPHVPDPLPS